MSGLDGYQRRYLRSLGHRLKPVVVVGKRGLSAELLSKVRAELAAHELIKVRFAEFKSERGPLAAEMAASCQSEVVGTVGNTALLFRAHDEPDKRRIRLPKRPGEPT